MTPSTRLFSDWKPAEIMLAVLFILAPLYYHPNLGGQGLRLPNNSTVWLLALVFIVYSLSKVLSANRFNIPRYFILIAAFPILVTLSGFIAGIEQPTDWLFRLLFIMGGLAFFFSLFQHQFTQAKIDKLLCLLALSGLVHAVVGIAQIYLRKDVPFFIPISPDGSPSGLFQQINNQTTFLVTLIGITFYLASRPVFRKKHLVLQALLALMVLLSSYVIGVSGSRIAALTLFVSLPVMLLARYRFLKANRRFSSLLLLAVIVGFAAGLVPSSGKMMDKTVAMQSGYSGSARLGMYKISLDLVAENPIFGHGIGSFARVWQQKKPEFYQHNPDAVLPDRMVSHPHNELVLWLVEGGLTALAGIVLVVAGVFLSLRRCGWQRGGAYLALMLPIALHTQVELPLYMSALHWFVLLFIMGLSFRHSLQQRQVALSRSAMRLTSFSVWLLGAIFVIFLAHTLRANWDFVAFYKGEQRENVLPYAKANPYLAQHAEWIDMSAIMYSSIQYGQKDNVVYYTKWGEAQLLKRPDVDLYTKLTDAYEFIGDKHNYCRIAAEGLLLYPRADRLKRAVEFCQY